MIGKRVSNISSSNEVFENESNPYQDALEQAPISRMVICFNPPFKESVKTKVGEKFMLLIDKYFGKIIEFILTDLLLQAKLRNCYIWTQKEHSEEDET